MWPFIAQLVEYVRSCFVLLCFSDFHSRSASKPMTVPGSLLFQLFTNLDAFL